MKRVLPGIVLLAFVACESSTATTPFAALPTNSADSTAPTGPLADELEICFFDVGQGDCTLVKCPDGRRILVDCGSLSKPRPDGAIVGQTIRAHLGTPARIDVLVITHPDQDHYNLIEDALKDIDLGKIVLPGDVEEAQDAEEVEAAIEEYGPLLDWLQTRSSKIRLVDGDDESRTASKIFGEGDTKFYILSANLAGDSNTGSIVLKVTYKKFDMILTGDATEVTERHVLAKFPRPTGNKKDWLDVDFLKIGHHGARATSEWKAETSSYSEATPWIRRLKPEYAMASSQKEAMHGHPNADVIRRGEEFYVPAQPHAVTTWFSKSKRDNDARWKTYDKAFWGTADAGTILVKSKGEDKAAIVVTEK